MVKNSITADRLTATFTDEAHEEMQKGWNGTFDQLDEYLAKV